MSFRLPQYVRARPRHRVPLSLSGALLAVVLLPPPVRAQDGFTRQVLFISPFESADRKLGGGIADALRGRVQKLFNRRELGVVGTREMEELLEQSGIRGVEAQNPVHVRALSKRMRADELVFGDIDRRGNRIHATARLVLARDERLVQPLVPVDAPTVDSAAAALAAQLGVLRRQLAPQRRCENAMREGQTARAIAYAQEGSKVSPRAVLVRTCLLTASLANGAPAADLVREARQILDVEPGSFWGLDVAARAYDVLQEKERASEMWLRLIETDTTNLELARRALRAMLEGGNAARAQARVASLSDSHPEDLELLRLRWQVLYTVHAWKEATAVGERMLVVDSMTQGDSTFALRLASAYQANGDPIRAVAAAADGVTRFPGDARLYLLYTEVLQADARDVIGRGLDRFPKAAELYFLRAQDLRRTGHVAESVEPLRRAIELDPRLGQGYLALAQSQIDIGLPDSALVSLQRALTMGEDSAGVAQFALARGNALYRAANGSKQRTDYLSALHFLALADSIRGSPQSRFLLGAAALSVSQSAATDAPKTNECGLSRLASELLPLAREKLTAGAEVAPDATRQYLAYLDQLEPVVSQQIGRLCTGGA
jgi:tetratricopeptide (TPR) repeat protein